MIVVDSMPEAAVQLPAALPAPIPAAQPAAYAPLPVARAPLSFFHALAHHTMPLNVDRTAPAAPSASLLPAASLTPAAAVSSTTPAPTPGSTLLDWLQAHWLWLVALLVLVALAYAFTRRKPHHGGATPERMAELRARKKK